MRQSNAARCTLSTLCQGRTPQGRVHADLGPRAGCGCIALQAPKEIRALGDRWDVVLLVLCRIHPVSLPLGAFVLSSIFLFGPSCRILSHSSLAAEPRLQRPSSRPRQHLKLINVGRLPGLSVGINHLLTGMAGNLPCLAAWLAASYRHSWGRLHLPLAPLVLYFISCRFFLVSYSSFVPPPLRVSHWFFSLSVVGLVRQSPFVDIRRAHCLKPPSPGISPTPDYHETACSLLA